MNIVTIPKKLAQRGDLVVIPREEYEEFSTWKKIVKTKLDDQWFWTYEWQKKEAEADEAIRKGKVVGPFSSHQKLTTALKRKRKP